MVDATSSYILNFSVFNGIYSSDSGEYRTRRCESVGEAAGESRKSGCLCVWKLYLLLYTTPWSWISFGVTNVFLIKFVLKEIQSPLQNDASRTHCPALLVGNTLKSLKSCPELGLNNQKVSLSCPCPFVYLRAPRISLNQTNPSANSEPRKRSCPQLDIASACVERIPN